MGNIFAVNNGLNERQRSPSSLVHFSLSNFASIGVNILCIASIGINTPRGTVQIHKLRARPRVTLASSPAGAHRYLCLHRHLSLVLGYISIPVKAPPKNSYTWHGRPPHLSLCFVWYHHYPHRIRIIFIKSYHPHRIVSLSLYSHHRHCIHIIVIVLYHRHCIRIIVIVIVESSLYLKVEIFRLVAP